MALLIIVLILVFGCTLTGLGVYLVAGLRRIERDVAELRALVEADGEPEPEPIHRRPILKLIKGGGPPVAALLVLGHRHWVRPVAAGAVAATAVALVLTLGQMTPPAAAPPRAGAEPTAVRLHPTASATQPPTAAAPSSPRPAAPTRAPSSGPTTTPPRKQPAMVVARVSAPAMLSGVVPTVSLRVPLQLPSAPPGIPTPPAPTPSPSASRCLAELEVPAVLGVCLL